MRKPRHGGASLHQKMSGLTGLERSVTKTVTSANNPTARLSPAPSTTSKQV